LKARSSIVAVGASILMLALSAPAAASANKPAGPRVVEVTVRAPVTPAAPVSIDAQCPPGTQVVGGGFVGYASQVGGPNGWAYSSRAIVSESRRIGRRVWRVTAIDERNPDYPYGTAPGATPAESIVHCARLTGKVVESSATGPLSTSNPSPSSAQAACPRGRTALAGGFSISPAPAPGFSFPALYESFRSGPRSWTTSATPYTQASVRVTSYAYCWDRPKPPRALANSQLARAVSSPLCRDGTEAVSGGFRAASDRPVDAFAGEGRLTKGPGPARPVWGRWRAAQTDLPAVNAPLTVFSYCA
jgi:hypothetical protein